MTQITYPNDITGSLQITQGSDGRLNVSSRSDTRAYYISRDRGQAFGVTFDDADAAAGDFIFYLQNTSTDKDLVIDTLDISTTVTGAFKIHFVTGTVSGGSSLTPTNLNRSSSNSAVVTCSGNGALSGLTSDGEIEMVALGNTEHATLDMRDRVRLGQNDAIALEFDRGSNTIAEGDCFFFFE